MYTNAYLILINIIAQREQMNLASGFLDGSDLYGVTEKELRAIRLYDGGKVDVAACKR